MIHVTGHAIQRFQERVQNLPVDQVEAALSSPFIQRAVEFGAKYVKLFNGARAVIRGGVIITVLPREHPAGLMNMARDEKYKMGEA